MRTIPPSVSVLLHRDGWAWVAQCLEFDIAAQGDTVAEVKIRFASTFGAQLAWNLHDGTEPFAGLKQAPQRYFDGLEETYVESEVELQTPRNLGLPTVTARFLVDRDADLNAP